MGCGIDRSDRQIDRSESDRALPNERTGTGRSKVAARFLFVLHNAQGAGSIDPTDRSIDLKVIELCRTSVMEQVDQKLLRVFCLFCSI